MGARARIVACALSALAVAIAIYFVWRDGTWLHRACPAVHHVLRPFGATHPVPAWVRFSLPDALWQYAFTAVILAIWNDQRWTPKKVVYVSLPAAIGCGHELAQLAHVLPGTFDTLDLLGTLVAVAAALVFHRDTYRAGPVRCIAVGE